MADTTFTNNVTLTDADWFQDVNRLHYTIFGDPADAAAARTAISALSAATQAEQEAGSSTTVGVTPGRQQFHPSACKGWAEATTNGTATASYNVSSITDAGTGNATCNWATDFSSASYAKFYIAQVDATGFSVVLNSSTTAGATNAVYRNTSGADTDPNLHNFAAFGDQA